MSERLKIGDSDLVTVAVDGILGLLSGITDSGAVIPVILGQIYPKDARDLPVICGHSPNENRNGVGRRDLETIAATVEITPVFRLPESHLDNLTARMGKVIAEIERRVVEKRSLYIDGQLVASDISLRRIDRGFTGTGSAAVAAARIELGCTIHHIAGVHDTVVATRPTRGSL